MVVVLATRERSWNTAPDLSIQCLTLNLIVAGVVACNLIGCRNEAQYSLGRPNAVAAPGNAYASMSQERQANSALPERVPRVAPKIFPDYNSFPSSQPDLRCQLDINLVQAHPDPATAAESRYWAANGVITILKDDATVDVALSGTLELLKDETPFASHWCIRAGTLDITSVGVLIARLTLLGDDDNAITLQENGEGKLIALFEDESATGSQIISRRYHLKLPVALSGNSFVIHLSTTRIGDLGTYRPRVTSDYKEDGVLEYVSDFAAYLRDFDLHTPLADMNDDDQWNGDDIDLWIDSFGEDYFAAARRWL